MTESGRPASMPPVVMSSRSPTRVAQRVPALIGAADQGHVPGILVVGEADDARDATR